MFQSFLNKFKAFIASVVSQQFDEVTKQILDMKAFQAELDAHGADVEADIVAIHEVLADIQNRLNDHQASVGVLKAQIAPSTVASISVTDAIRDACKQSGLPMHQINDQFDLAKAGKLNDVIVHMSKSLGTQHPLRTVGDVVRLFEE